MSDASLRGRSIVVTRPEKGDGPLASALAARGATPVHRAVLEIRSVEGDALERALAELDDVDWLVLTSSRAVDALRQAGTFDVSPPEHLRVAVVGPRTAAAVHGAGWPVHVEPGEAGAVGLLLALESRRIGRRDRVLFPASARVRDLVPDGLRARGARVDVVPVYTPVARSLDPHRWTPSSSAPPWSALTFTSPSAVTALVEGLPDATLQALRALPAGVQGPTTGEAARNAGWALVVEARPRTFDGLAAALADHFVDSDAEPS